MSKYLDEDLLCLNPNAELQNGSFVLYRSEGAIVSDISLEKRHIKLQIQTESGKKVRVRPKDVSLLSSDVGPSTQLSQLTQRLSRDELEEGWNLLQEMGPNCSLVDLAEAVFSSNGPRELYNAFCLINETPYFKGRPDEIMVRSQQEVREEQERQQRKQLEAERWQRFYQHYQEGHYSEEDLSFIEEIEAIAYGEKQTCRLFREIKLEATPENAHEWLLRQQLWSDRFNPYPRRNQLLEQPPQLPQLLNETEYQQWQDLLQRFQEAARQLPPVCADPTADPASLPARQPMLDDAQLQTLEQLLHDFCAQQPLSYPVSATGQALESVDTPVIDISLTSVPPPLAETQPNRQPSEASPAVGLWQTQKRRNLTHLSAWAIDDPWSRDPDDAISIEWDTDGTENTGAVSLWIHIADPASLLPFGSRLAAEALQCGATVYLPEGVTAMLPRELVQILGLGLQNINMALSVRVCVLPPQESGDASDTVSDPARPLAKTVEVLDLCRSWVRVQRLSYDQVDQILQQAEAKHPLQQLWQLCQTHLKARQANHAVQFNMYNTKVVAGEPITIENLPNTASRDLVAEAMLMAGAAMAQFAQYHQLPISFLCQAPPKEALPPLDNMANMFQARKLMSPSTVRCEAQPHSSIGVPMYTRGTSPLRRYLDLLTHQQLHAFLLQGEGQPLRCLNSEELLYCNAQAEIQVSRVNSAQRASQQHWQMLYLKQEGKQRLYQAVVLDVRHSGKQQSSGCKALCSLSELGIESVVFSKAPLQLNQELRVSLKGVNLSTREAHFQVAAGA